MKYQKKRGLLATIGALATAAALVLGGAAAAQAVTINLSSTVNLNIVKLKTPEAATLDPTGLPVAETALPDGTDTEYVAGVEFTVKQVLSFTPQGQSTPVTDVNLETNAGWLAAAGVRYDASADQWFDGPDEIAVTFGTTRTGTTDSNGVPQSGGSAAFQGMPIGLYFVEETGTPAGVTPAIPFSVSLPMTNPVDLDEWLYSVYVYPKNAQVDAPVKTVVDLHPYKNDAADTSPVADQQRISFGISAEIPRLPGATTGTFGKPDAFRITDQLNDAFTPVTPTTTGITVKIADDAGNAGTSLVEATDYAVSNTGAGGNLTIDFMSTGLDKLQAAASNPNLNVFVNVLVDVSHTATGTISNQVRVYPNQAAIDNGDTAPVQYLESNTVNTKWGAISFTKVDEDANALSGAKFNVYLNEADARAGTNALRSAEVTSTSDVSNNVSITGLRHSDFAGNAAVVAGNPGYVSYWLAEVEAPNGYELLAAPIHVALTESGVFLANTDGSASATALGNVVNVEANAGFELPLTGGMGTAFLTIGGIAILAIVLLVARRRRDAEVGAE